MTTYTENYPSLLGRMKAYFIDMLVILIFMSVASVILSNIESVPNTLRISIFCFIFFIYDPLFISLFGGTAGHMVVGIRVKQEKDTHKNLSLYLSFFRFIVKVFLGIISFFTMTASPKKQAIHDSVTGSVVIYAY